MQHRVMLRGGPRRVTRSQIRRVSDLVASTGATSHGHTAALNVSPAKRSTAPEHPHNAPGPSFRQEPAQEQTAHFRQQQSHDSPLKMADNLPSEFDVAVIGTGTGGTPSGPGRGFRLRRGARGGERAGCRGWGRARGCRSGAGPVPTGPDRSLQGPAEPLFWEWLFGGRLRPAGGWACNAEQPPASRELADCVRQLLPPSRSDASAPPTRIQMLPWRLTSGF